MMRIPFTLFLIAAFLAGSAAVRGAVVEVRSASVTAADLAPSAEIFAQADPDVRLAVSPAPGVTRKVSRWELARWAASAGVEPPPGSLPASLMIRRALRRLERGEALAAIRSAAAKRWGADPETIELELPDFEPPLIPDGPLRFEFSRLPARLNQPAPARLRWRDPGGRSGSLSLEAVVRLRGEWAAARRNLPRGARLGTGDVAIRQGFVPLDPKLLLPAAELARMPLLRAALAAGEPVLIRQVSFPPLVERGGLLELRLDRGAVRLRASARAEQSGSAGEVIAFRNLSTGQRVMARILNRGVAVVDRGRGQEADARGAPRAMQGDAHGAR